MTDLSATTPEPVAPLSDWEMKAVAQAKLETELFTLNKGALLDALARCNNNVSDAAKLLGLSRYTAYRTMHRSGLQIRREVTEK